MTFLLAFCPIISIYSFNGVEVVAVVRPGSRRADRIKTSDMVKRVD